MAVVALLPALISMLPSLVDTVLRLVEAAQRDPAASEPENKAVLDALAVRLRATADKVEAVELPDRQ